MLAEKNPYIESDYQHLQLISQDKQKRLEYEAREKAVRDYNQGMLEAEQRGRKEGHQEGRKEGEQERNIQIAKNLIKEASSTDFISKITGLSEKEIEELR